MIISIGSDHHGILIRMKLCDMVRQLGHTVKDHGPAAKETEPVDYFFKISIQTA
jgi:ribose 5-phosphate isomerase RpiB